MQSCKTCRFAFEVDPLKNPGAAMCRFNPPVVQLLQVPHPIQAGRVDIQVQGFQPPTNLESGWCGKHEPKAGGGIVS